MRTVLLASVALTTVISAKPALTAPVCTESQKDVYYTDERDFCELQTKDFEVCDDRCLASLTKLKSAAPDCKLRDSFSWTLASRAAEHLASCVSLRANSTTVGKYVPPSTTGLPVCTDEVLDPWEKAYESGSPPHDDCKTATTNGTACTDDCLSKLHETVLKAPLCMAEAGQGYWVGEVQKVYVQLCLVSRGGSVADDEAMRTQLGSDGKLKATDVTLASVATSTTLAPTAPTAPSAGSSAPSPSSAAASVLVSALVVCSSLATALML